jgi:hypothetical protein
MQLIISTEVYDHQGAIVKRPDYVQTITIDDSLPHIRQAIAERIFKAYPNASIVGEAIA